MEKLNRCRLCNRNAKYSTGYCHYHHLSFERLKEAYRIWEDRLGISWTEFLEKMITKRGVGIWSKEVAKDVLDSLF